MASLVIVLCMIVHCASRLGFLSYLYENRNAIAYQIGFITEIPIAICSSDYDFNKGLSIQQEDSGHLPGGIPEAEEIILFAPAESSDLSFLSAFIELKTDGYFQIVNYLRPHVDIFHPPLG